MFENNERHDTRGEKIACIILGALALGAVAFAGYQALKIVGMAVASASDRQAESDCIELAKEAKERVPYSKERPGGFYLAKWQSEMCREVNIHVDAPVL